MQTCRAMGPTSASETIFRPQFITLIGPLLMQLYPPAPQATSKPAQDRKLHVLELRTVQLCACPVGQFSRIVLHKQPRAHLQVTAGVPRPSYLGGTPTGQPSGNVPKERTTRLQISLPLQAPVRGE